MAKERGLTPHDTVWQTVLDYLDGWDWPLWSDEEEAGLIAALLGGPAGAPPPGALRGPWAADLAKT